MEWKPVPQYESMAVKNSHALSNDAGTAVLLWVRTVEGKWMANYFQDGVVGNDIYFDQPIEGATTLEEAKALGLMMMHMGG